MFKNNLDKNISNRRKNVRFSDGLFPGQSVSTGEINNLGILIKLNCLKIIAFKSLEYLFFKRLY